MTPATHAEMLWEAVNYIHDNIPPVNQIPEFVRAVKASLSARQYCNTRVCDGLILRGLATQLAGRIKLRIEGEVALFTSVFINDFSETGKYKIIENLKFYIFALNLYFHRK